MTGNGVVLRGTGGVWQVRDEGGDVFDVSLRGRLKQLAALKLCVGDEVRLEQTGDGWAIAEILERRSQLVRRSPGGRFGERVVATNIDQVVVVFAAAQPEPHPRMLDRFLVIAAANDLPTRIVLNKMELAGARDVRHRFEMYERAGYPLHLTSVKQGTGLDELRETLARQVSALSGPSGVGKSSLLNSMFPGLKLRVGEISWSVMKGRHTTVGAEMHPLPEGGYVMDTPGLREVGVWGITPEELARCFVELRPYIDQCRFGDCAHRVEPGCAVLEAVQSGEVSSERYESYAKLREELEESLPPRWEREERR